jgi:hypothetical protein
MESIDRNPFDRKKLTADILNEWQNLLNESAEILGVPAGLITRLNGKEIEILLSSKTEGNPYPADYVSTYPDSGWFCEYTLKTNGLNLIPNALLDPMWKDNPAAVDLHMLSYVGMPIERPDGGQFGTVCFIDNKQNAHNELHIRLIAQIKKMVELTLRIVDAKEEIDKRDRLINDLSRIYPICSYCKKVREDSGDWVSVEKYVKDISGAKPSHSVCPECFKKQLKELETF